MKRLTYKDEKVCGGYSAVETDEFACVGKLGQLEDIEEELGIDLVTLLKALDYKNIKYFDDGCEWHYVQLNYENKSFICPDGAEYYLKDYGKTWALTKEELL